MRGYEVAEVFGKGFRLQNEIAWVKSIAIDEVTRGHFKPINSKRYLNRTFEKLFHFSRLGTVTIDRLAVGVPYVDKTNVRRWGSVDRDRRCGGNTWFIPYETVRSRAGKFNHPAGFPVDLAQRCLQMVGGTGIVLDPFAGCGSTLVAAQKLGMGGIGIELNPLYAQSAYDRLVELTNRQ